MPLINNLRSNPKWDMVVRTRDWHAQDHVSFCSNHPGKKLFETVHLEENNTDQVMWPDHCVQNSWGAQYQ